MQFKHKSCTLNIFFACCAQSKCQGIPFVHWFHR